MGSPARGEIWWVDLEPTVGSEIGKRRPGVVLSSDVFGHLPVRLVVPLTTWQDKFGSHMNKTRIEASQLNCLPSTSAADVIQMRCISVERFADRIGRLEADLLDELAAALAVVVDVYN